MWFAEMCTGTNVLKMTGRTPSQMEPPEGQLLEGEVGRRKERWEHRNEFSVSMHRKSKKVHTHLQTNKKGTKAKGFYRCEAHLLSDK